MNAAILLIFLKDCPDGIGVTIKVEDIEFSPKYWEKFDYEIEGDRLYIYNIEKDDDYIAFDKLDELEVVDDEYLCFVQNDNMIIEFEML